MSRDRRAFLKKSAAALSVVSLGAEGLEAAEPTTCARPSRALDATMLRAVGDAVLPADIGAEGRETAVLAFELWLSEFQPVAELVHPYGGSEVPYGPPDPEPGWAAQLEALDLLARAREGVGFADLGIEARRTLLRGQMGEVGPGMPNPARAAHVAVALMAHYFTSPDAIDRCYGARIGRRECRGTEDVGRRPNPLGGARP